MVYVDAEQLYSEVAKDGETLLEEAFTALFPKSTAVPTAVAGDIVGFNTTPFSRRDVITVPLSSSAHLKSKVVQASKDGATGYALLDCSKGGMVTSSSSHASGVAHTTPVPRGP